MVRILGAILVVSLTGVPAAQAAPLSAEELLREPVVEDIALSPDGKRIAIAGKLGETHGIVAVVDADRLGDNAAVNKFAIGTPGKFSPMWVMWANDKRLLVGLQVGLDSKSPLFGRQVEAIDPDGTHQVELFSGATGALAFSFDLSHVVDLTPDDPDHVIMSAWNLGATDLYQVDVNTGVAVDIAHGRQGATIGWAVENGKPALRYDANRRHTEISVYGRKTDGEETGDEAKDWSLVAKYRTKDFGQDWDYAGDAPGAGKIYVRQRQSGSDTSNIYAYDIRTNQVGALVAQVPGYDMSIAFTIDSQYAGAGYIADTTMYVLSDRKLQSHWNGMRNYFKQQANVRIVDVDRLHSKMLIHVSGPQAPGDFYLYDVAKAKLTFIASARPWLEPEKLAAVEVVKSPMRDGTSITSYLTRPNGVSGALPLVVMPHGGPETRDYVDYDPVVQAFAAQGWLVLQPNFRGSSGYGEAFAAAGYRQFGGRMQDDVTDATLDLVKRGIADGQRIVIYGASYGGYAALIGAVVTPDLYRAAVSRAGVSDLRAMLSYERSEDGPASETYAYVVKIVGDPKRDRQMIEAASPRLRAGEIRIPILLMHGKNDTTVPIEQSEMMKKALEKAGKSVKYLAFDNEDHGGWTIEDEIKQVDTAIDFFKPVLK